MGEEQSHDRAQLGATFDGGSETRDPDEIRADIERTRRELGDTVAAVAEKADVKAHARAKVSEVKGRAAQRRDELAGRTRNAVPDSGAEAAAQARAAAKENRVPLIAAGAFCAGLLVGRLAATR
jgi:hypothetical protein